MIKFVKYQFMIKTFTNLFFTTVLLAVNSQAQTIQEPDYTLNYKDNKIEVTFNKGVSSKLFDNKTQTQKRIAPGTQPKHFCFRQPKSCTGHQTRIYL